MPATRNIDQIVAYLDWFVASFDFTRPGIAQNLGRDVANVVVERIQKQSSEELAGPDGNPWPQNSTQESPKGGYKGWKIRKYG